MVNDNPITAAEMRALEQEAIESGRVTGLDLMERAGQGVVDAIFVEWPELENGPRRAVVLCGPGNNGGDGFVVARLLKASGWDVEVYFYGDPQKLPLDARKNFLLWQKLEPAHALTDEVFDGYSDDHPETALYIDALFGTGLRRPFLSLDKIHMELNYCQAKPDTKVVCVDFPSGMSADSGTYPGYEGENPMDVCICANLTVTFHRPKHGHLIEDGPNACGKLVVKDIGL